MILILLGNPTRERKDYKKKVETTGIYAHIVFKRDDITGPLHW